MLEVKNSKDLRLRNFLSVFNFHRFLEKVVLKNF